MLEVLRGDGDCFVFGFSAESISQRSRRRLQAVYPVRLEIACTHEQAIERIPSLTSEEASQDARMSML